ncbi:MAG: c-type cytochrome [Phycisphaerales bacterium JB038]
MPPKPVIYIGIVLVVLSWIPLAIITKARLQRSTEPRVHFFQDMDIQPKVKTQTANPLFADGRGMRPPVEGTVARGRFSEDQHFAEGKAQRDGEEIWADGYPAGIDITEEFLRRGQQRFDIFCATCHGLTGEGNGPIAQRADELEAGKWGWIPPTSMHAESVLERENGHLFNTISNGIRTMPAYGSQIPVEDRWAIVAYIRALQLSRSATVQDVPADQRDQINEPGD